MADATSTILRNVRPNMTGSNILIFAASFFLLVLFAYFIYNFLFVNYKVSITSTGNILLSTPIKANDVANAKRDITKIPDTNSQIPTITEGGEFTVSFWLYISSYNTINFGKRKHIFEIYGDNFSTLLVALGARTPTLLVRVHTIADLDPSGNQWGLTDCSGTVRNVAGQRLLTDCSGIKLGFQELTDRNLMNTMKDNTLPKDEVNRFFRAVVNVDENNLIDSTSTCDYKSLDLSTWNNVCLVMNSKTLEIYLNGKLVKSCVYHSYFRVDNSGLKVSYLQQQANFDGYLSRIQLFNNVLNPDEIYKNYLQGPDGKSITSDPLSFLKYIFTS